MALSWITPLVMVSRVDPIVTVSPSVLVGDSVTVTTGVLATRGIDDTGIVINGGVNNLSNTSSQSIWASCGLLPCRCTANAITARMTARTALLRPACNRNSGSGITRIPLLQTIDNMVDLFNGDLVVFYQVRHQGHKRTAGEPVGK